MLAKALDAQERPTKQPVRVRSVSVAAVVVDVSVPSAAQKDVAVDETRIASTAQSEITSAASERLTSARDELRTTMPALPRSERVSARVSVPVTDDPKSKSVSAAVGEARNLTRHTAVKPPAVARLKVCLPSEK